MLSYLQRVKRNAYIKDKYELENEVTDLFKEEDKKQVEKVRFHMAKDKEDGEIVVKCPSCPLKIKILFDKAFLSKFR